MITTTTPVRNQILQRALASANGTGMSPEAARYFLQLQFGPQDRERLEYLAARAQEGTLTEAEKQENAENRQVGRLLALLQIEARRALGQPLPAPGTHP